MDTAAKSYAEITRRPTRVYTRAPEYRNQRGNRNQHGNMNLKSRDNSYYGYDHRYYGHDNRRNYGYDHRYKGYGNRVNDQVADRYNGYNNGYENRAHDRTGNTAMYEKFTREIPHFKTTLKNLYQGTQLRHHMETWKTLPTPINARIEQLMRFIRPPMPNTDLTNTKNEMEAEIKKVIQSGISKHLSTELNKNSTLLLNTELTAEAIAAAGSLAKPVLNRKYTKKLDSTKITKWLNTDLSTIKIIASSTPTGTTSKTTAQTTTTAAEKTTAEKTTTTATATTTSTSKWWN